MGKINGWKKWSVGFKVEKVSLRSLVIVDLDCGVLYCSVVGLNIWLSHPFKYSVYQGRNGVRIYSGKSWY